MSDEFARVQAVLSEHLGRDPREIAPTSRLQADLGADSLDMVEIAMALEDEFGVSISDAQARAMTTAADALGTVLDAWAAGRRAA